MKKGWMIICVLLLLSIIVLTAAAEDAEPTKYTSGYYEYILLEDGTAEITDYIGFPKESHVDIPEEINGYVVSSIGDCVFASNFITHISIPDSVIRMGENPFYSCTKLKSIKVSPDNVSFAVIDGVLFNKPEKRLVCYPEGFEQKAYSIPSGIKEIGAYAFHWNLCLEKIDIPDSVSVIDKAAFINCSNLKNVNISNNISFIGDYAFSGCDALLSINIPPKVISIGKNAFSGCELLESVILPEGLKVIDDYAFASCKSLHHISIPESVTTLGDCVFSWCYSLESVNIPYGLTYMGMNPFYCCDNVKIDLSSENTSFQIIDDVLFSVDEMKLIYFPIKSLRTDYVIPTGCTVIGYGAFAGCDNLVRVSISDGVASIEDYAFCECNLLKEVGIPITVENIGDLAFAGCDKLTDIIIPEGVTSIGKWIFDGCYMLENVTLPKSITSIGDKAFYCCPELTVTVEQGSYAAQWCKENNVDYTYTDSLDWLND